MKSWKERDGIGFGEGKWIKNGMSHSAWGRHVLRMRVASSVENYSNLSVEQTVITVIGNEDLRKLILVEKIFLADFNA